MGVCNSTEAAAVWIRPTSGLHEAAVQDELRALRHLLRIDARGFHIRYDGETCVVVTLAGRSIETFEKGGVDRFLTLTLGRNDRERLRCKRIDASPRNILGCPGPLLGVVGHVCRVSESGYRTLAKARLHRSGISIKDRCPNVKVN